MMWTANSKTRWAARLGAATAVAALLMSCGGSGSEQGPMDETPQTRAWPPVAELPPDEPPIAARVSLLAGNASGHGFQDGPLDVARLDGSFWSFNSGTLLSRAPDGQILLVDTGNNAIRALGADGQLSTLAGTGVAGGRALDGPGWLAQFDQPRAVAADTAGNVYVADTANHLLRRIGTDGTVSTLAGLGQCGNDDGGPNTATLCRPQSVAVDVDGSIYVSEVRMEKAPPSEYEYDADQYEVVANPIRKISPDGRVSTFLARASETAGRGGPSFSVTDWLDHGNLNMPILPVVLATREEEPGILYVADANDGVVRRHLPDGSVDTITISSYLSTGNGARRQEVSDETPLVFDSITIGDNGERLVVGTLGEEPPNLWTIGSDGTATPVVHNLATICQNQLGQSDPHACGVLAAAPDGKGGFILMLAERRELARYVPATGELAMLTDQRRRAGSARLDGQNETLAYSDGPGSSATFMEKSRFAVASDGRMYTLDYPHVMTPHGPIPAAGFLLRSIFRDGMTSTVLDGKLPVYGGPTNEPPILGSSMIDNDIYIIADSDNHHDLDSGNRLLKISVPERGQASLADVLDLDESLRSSGLPIDWRSQIEAVQAGPDGEVYVAAGTISKPGTTIYRIDADGRADLVAGSTEHELPGHQDGHGKAAQFTWIVALAHDGKNLYALDAGWPDYFFASDQEAERAPVAPTLRKITPNGEVTTVAGRPGVLPSRQYVQGSRDAFAYWFAWPAYTAPPGLAVSSEGQIYVSNPDANIVLSIAPDGQIRTLAGRPGRRGFEAGPAPGLLDTPSQLGLHGRTLYVKMPTGIAQIDIE